MRARILGSIAVLLVLAPSGCRTTYDHRYYFKPRPLVVDVAGPSDEGFVARAVVAVVAVRDADPKQGRPQEVQLRLQLENLSSIPIALDERRWKLVSADLLEFGAAQIQPQPVPDVLPGAETTVELSFPVLPERSLGDYDLSGLNLRFGVRWGEATIVVSATFERWVVDPYYPYGYPGVSYGPYTSYHVGFGFGI